MEASQIDRVRTVVAGSIAVEITWHERGWLLKKISVVPGYERIVAKFEVAGTSRSVRLEPDEQTRLLAPLVF